MLLPASLALALAAAEPQAVAKVLTLDEAVRLTLERQPLLRQAQANTSVARARADESRAPLLPQVNLGANYQYGTHNSTLRSGVGGTVVPGSDGGGTTTPSFAGASAFTLQASASILLWDFGQTWNRWQSALSLAEAQQAQERAQALQAVLNTQTAYFAARAQKQLVAVARETLENQQHHLQQTQAFVQVGTQPPIALAQTKTAVANAQVQLISAENNYQTAKAQLNHAMGVEGPTDYELADQELAPLQGEDASVDKLLEQALAARPEFAALERQVRAQQLTITAVSGGFWPSVSASTTFTDAGTRLNALTWDWSARINLSWAVFQGGLTTAQVAEARASLVALESQRDLLRQQVRLDVEQASLTLEGAKAALAASEEALLNAREQLRLAEGRYQTGTGSIIELGDAQVAATSAGAQVAQARFNVATARAHLLEALGGPSR